MNPDFKFVPGETLIFFDEIQDCINCATSLKPFRQDGRYDVICSGSLMGINYQEIESNSVGNKEDYEMYSMDFEEFLWAKGYKEKQIEDMYNCMINLKPLTNTQLTVMFDNFKEYMVIGGMPEVVRTFVKNNCLHTSKTHKKDSKGKRARYTELMRECSLTAPQYLMLKRAFQGGFTHASMKYSGYLLKDVFSIDFTSSYPFVMLSEKFPMSRPVPVDVRTVNFWELVDDENTGLLFDCKITGLHALNTYETYLSESKCQKLKGGIINNGRIFEAEELITTITDIDLKIIKKCYSYDSISITNCYKFYMSYLPKSFIESILTLYEKKTTLKGVEGKEVEYLVSKGMLNSCYGMCVTDIVKEENKYTTEWEKIPVSESQLEEQIEKYNESKTRFLYYPWGVWVTAYARRNLWTGIINIGEDYVYSDTDSIKFLNYEKHVSFIESYNKRVEYKLKKMCDFLHIDFNRCKPKTKKGVEKLIGVWDLEGNYEYFKTLGAKRYMYQQNGEIHITIAGLSKQNGVQYLKMTCKDNIDIFNHFTNNLYIPAEYTGKNTHTYIDEKQEGDITDYLGHTTHVISLSAVHLCEADFTLNIALQYNKFLTMLRQGYLFTGTKCI